ncbi:MAG: leucine-rich repeat domain-containing protein [Clostridia bacterium]|nr:leucine-rich repeat domain-containing protein [Clostridia bacterium]
MGIGTCSDTDVIIPGTYNDKPVTHIGVRAFEYCGKLTSIVIPDSVTGISSDAFANCANLTSITIGKGVKAVSGGVFEYCKKLKEIHISDIASWCNIKWSDNPFDYHYASELYLNGKLLTDLIIPNGVTSVAGAACRSYDKLASVTIPDSVTSIGDQAFYSCDALASITIGSGVASIGNTAFGASKALKSITVSPSNPVYHSEENCLIQTETKTLILGCETSVIPADGSVTMIGSSAFCYESLLTSIVIPAGVTEVGEYAFSGCENLQSVTFPNTLKWIASKSFAQCPLVDIYFNGTKAEWDAVPKSSGYQREWDDGAYNYTVHCSDGDIVSDG